MKYKAVIDTDNYKDFEFFKDGNGKYMVARDAGGDAYGGWIPLYFTECEQEAKWIPVTERPPEEPGNYLVTLDYKEHGTGVTTLWFHGSLGWDSRAADVVTAWMPLPEGYKV